MLYPDDDDNQRVLKIKKVGPWPYMTDSLGPRSDSCMECYVCGRGPQRSPLVTKGLAGILLCVIKQLT